MLARTNRKLKEEKRKNNIKDDPTYYVDRDRAAAVVTGSKDIKSELKVFLIYCAFNLQLININPLNNYIHIYVLCIFVQKKSRSDAKTREDDNPFLSSISGMGCGANVNYDACIAQGEHELK